MAWDWIDNLLEDPLGSIGRGASSIWGSLNDDKGFEIEDIVGLLGGAAGYAGWFDPEQERVGYQGKIPRYTAVRDRVPVSSDQEIRRPGEYGRRYFTDTTYAQRPDAGIPTLVEAEAEAQAQRQGLMDLNRRTRKNIRGLSGGGLASLGYYMGGPTGGMDDAIPTSIGGSQPAALSHGEFVLPADIVSHLGNGNSNAGANELYSMMDRIRKARTGSTKQGKQIDPNKFTPV